MRVIKVVLGRVSRLGNTLMDASLTGATNLAYSNQPPVLIAASSDAAMALAKRTILASSLRVGAKVPIEQASERLEFQIATAALWVEIDRDCGGPMDDLLSCLSRDVAAGRYAAVVSTTSKFVDPLAARIDAGAVELIVEADDAERVAALAIATARHGLPLRLADVASERNAERLRQLSEEVNRSHRLWRAFPLGRRRHRGRSKSPR